MDNKRDGGENIQVRLDRGTCNDEFLTLFPETNVEHIVTEESDHMALVIHALETAPVRGPQGARQFKFEEAWTRHVNYEAMVADQWNRAASGEVGLTVVCNRLGRLTAGMQEWGRVVFGSVRKQIMQLKAQLQDAKYRALGSGYTTEIKDIEEQLREVYAREEVLQRQRSRVDWLSAGNMNTKYFQG